MGCHKGKVEVEPYDSSFSKDKHTAFLVGSGYVGACVSDGLISSVCIRSPDLTIYYLPTHMSDSVSWRRISEETQPDEGVTKTGCV